MIVLQRKTRGTAMEKRRNDCLNSGCVSDMKIPICQEAGHMEENLTQIKQDTMIFFDGHREVY